MKTFSRKAILISSLLCGPIAGFWMMYKNYKSVGDKKRAVEMIWCMVFIFLVLGTSVIWNIHISDLTLGLILFLSVVVTSRLQKNITKENADFTKVLAISLASLIITFAYLFTLVYFFNNNQVVSIEAPAKITYPFKVEHLSYNLDSNVTKTDEDSTLYAEYPQILFDGLNINAVNKINKSIKEQTEHDFEVFKKDITSTAKDMGDDSKNLSYNQTILDDYYLSTSTKIFSYAYSQDWYTGGAHPNSSIGMHTFDLNTGKELGIEHFIKGKEKAVKALIYSYIEESIKTEDDTENCQNCARINLDSLDLLKEYLDKSSLKNFTVSDSGIFFYFSNYELASYVETAGGQRVFVPNSKI